MWRCTEGKRRDSIAKSCRKSRSRASSGTGMWRWTARISTPTAPLTPSSSRYRLKSPTVLLMKTFFSLFKQVEAANGTNPFILSIENATIEDNGRYLCAVKNSFGLSIQGATLAVGKSLSSVSNVLWNSFFSLLTVDLEEAQLKHDRKLIFFFSGILSASVIVLIALSTWIFRCFKYGPPLLLRQRLKYFFKIFFVGLKPYKLNRAHRSSQKKLLSFPLPMQMFS